MGLLGDFLSGRRSQKAAGQAQDFSERMSNTAWQRGMEDMRKAGLNPILAYKAGPASSPMGTMASFPSTGDIGQTAVAAGKAITGMKTARKERELKSATTEKMATAAAVDRATTAKTQADTVRQTVETQLEAAKIPRAQVEAGFATTAAGKAAIAGQYGKGLAPMSGAMAAFGHFFKNKGKGNTSSKRNAEALRKYNRNNPY